VMGEPVGMDLILGGNEPRGGGRRGSRDGDRPSEVPHITLAAAAGNGPTQAEQILVVGEAVEAVRRPFKRAQNQPGRDLRVTGLSVMRVHLLAATSVWLWPFKEMAGHGNSPASPTRLARSCSSTGEDADLQPGVTQGAVVLHVGKCQRSSKRLGPLGPRLPSRPQPDQGHPARGHRVSEARVASTVVARGL